MLPEPQLLRRTFCLAWGHKEAKVELQRYQTAGLAISRLSNGLMQLIWIITVGALENINCFLNVINCPHLLQSLRRRSHVALGRTWGCREAHSPSVPSWWTSTWAGRKPRGGNVLLELAVWDHPLAFPSFPPPPAKLRSQNTQFRWF